MPYFVVFRLCPGLHPAMTREAGLVSPEVHIIRQNKNNHLVSYSRMEFWIYIHIYPKLSSMSPPFFPLVPGIHSFIDLFIHSLTHLFVLSFNKNTSSPLVSSFFILTIDFCILCLYSKIMKSSKIYWLIFVNVFWTD